MGTKKYFKKTSAFNSKLSDFELKFNKILINVDKTINKAKLHIKKQNEEI